MATSPLPSRGSPPLQSGGQNQKWPSCGQSGYVTPAVLGIPTAAERGGKFEVAHLWARWLRHPCRLGDCQGENQKWPTYGQSGCVTPAVSGIPTASEGGAKSEVAHFGQSGYVTPAVSGIPTAVERGAKSEMAHLWAKWLCDPRCLGDPHRCRAGSKIRSGPLVGKVATSPLPSRGSPPLQSGGGELEVAHLWAKWLRHPCHLGDPHRFKAGGGGIRSGPIVGKVATSPLPSRESPPLQSGGQNQKWPTSGQSPCVTTAVSGIPTASERGAKSEVAHFGQSGYVTPAVSGIPTASERVGESKVAHLWAKCLRHPRRLGDPQRCRAGGKIRSGPLVGKPATSPRRLKRWGESQVAHLWAKWLRHHRRLGDPHRLRAGGKIRSGPLWAKWLRHPCRLGDPHRFRAGGKIRSGPLVGKVATSPLPSRGSPPLQSGWENPKWPTCGQSGYVNPAVSGIPTAVERRAKSEVVHL